jgi:hypothetical protein
VSDFELGWHWLPNNRELQWNGNGRVLGTWDICHVAPPLEMCRSGLHWSPRIIDALRYSPGNICCRVESWGDTMHGAAKAVSRNRRIVWWVDAEMVLWSWLCDVAEKACADHGVTDKRSLAAIQLRRDWLGGAVVTDRQWDAARDAAWYAARAAARAAAGAAAGAAARAAARAAAWYAAWAAAWAAAGAAAGAAARAAAGAAARAAQNKSLEAAIRSEAKRLHIADWEK